MKKLLIALTILLMPATCSANYWVCYDAITKQDVKRLNGDCTVLGICTGPNHDGLLPNCFSATKEEFDEAGQADKKIENGTVVDLTKAEKDAKTAKQQQDKDAAKVTADTSLDNSIVGISVSDVDLPQSDAEIDALKDLDEVKSYLKKLLRVRNEKNNP